MKRLLRYGMQVTFIVAICVALLAISVQPVYANEDAAKQAAIERAHQAIDALPDFPDITAEHRSQVEEARRLVDAAFAAGATRFDLCLKGVRLEMIEEKLDKFIDDDLALPPTGGFEAPLVLGLMLTGSGVLLAKRNREKQ